MKIGSKLKLKPVRKSRARNFGPQNESVPRLNRPAGIKHERLLLTLFLSFGSVGCIADQGCRIQIWRLTQKEENRADNGHVALHAAATYDEAKIPARPRWR